MCVEESKRQFAPVLFIAKPSAIITMSYMKTLTLIPLFFFTFAVHAQNFQGNQEDIDLILSNIKGFSNAVMNSAYQSIGDAYTDDAKIFPNNREIIKGREAIIRYWILPEGVQTKYHKITPEEIKIMGNEAYDYGYYEGITLRADGTEASWKGKYVIVSEKVNQDWKMYLGYLEWNKGLTK
ncbi:DUF4440 domain-containing protein [Maribacter litopenaei]|uniref:DUF4440 domain-containing protein n=1 Tax=Maribacter litopenaei TaxID=2976127 RepID=A0ABY5Y759_9FLAO|nr:DUF4440 domain-containing protein [Maribacter litopenaei]UWX54862.1 DUF4440 domain-containing protein [Maribacter litopenaei]